MPAQVLNLRPIGLVTDPSAVIAPDGALLQATNVWIQRPGVVEPRPGLAAQSISSLSVPSGYSIYQLFPFEDDLVAVATDGSGNWRCYSVTAGTTHQIGGSAAWTSTIGCVHAAQAAGNLYVTTDKGVIRITSNAPSGSQNYRAGLERPPQTRPLRDTSTTTSPNQVCPANSAVAYRYVAKRKIGDRYIYSAPSGRVVHRNVTGDGDSGVTLNTDTITLGTGSSTNGDNLSTDELEIYRSVAFTSAYTDEPSDEMVQIGTAPQASGGTGFFDDFVDDTPTTSNAGPALYTNGTQRGANQENGRPPMCRDIAEYNGMMFFGGAVWPATLTVQIGAMGDDWRGSATGKQERFTTFTITGDTSSNTTVSNVSAADIAKLHVGQRVFLDGSTPDIADARFASGTLITAIGASSFTISAAALTSTIGVTIRVCDWIEFSSTNGSGTTTMREYMHTSYGSSAATSYVDANDFETGTGVIVGGAVGLAQHATTYLDGQTAGLRVTALGDGYYTPWSLLVEQVGSLSRTSPSTITVKTSNPRVTFPRCDSSTGVTNTVRGGINVLAWSQLNEPEHVPPVEYQTEIGSAEHAIQRIVSCRDGLYVFKTDGIWRVSGYSPQTLTVDEYDRSLALVHPDAVCAYEGLAAAWTNKGVALIGDGQTRIISQPIAETLSDVAASVSSTTRGTFMAAWPYQQCIILRESVTGAMYVHCLRTGAWVAWTHTVTVHSAAAVAGYLYMGGVSSSTATLLKSNSTTKDVETSITISAVDADGTGITINAGSGWTPAVNDCVVQSSVAYAITAVTSATVFTVQSAGLTAAAATAEEGADVAVWFPFQYAGNPMAQKLWREVSWYFSDHTGLCRITFQFFSSRYFAGETANYFETFTTSAGAPRNIRVPVPRNSKRSVGIGGGISTSGPRMAWKFHSAALSYVPMSERVGNHDAA
jgi:hypothetical protein